MLYQAKRRATKQGVPFGITQAYLEQIWTDKCPVFGTSWAPLLCGKPQPTSPTLDRTKPELGYVPGNVRVISHRANQVKSNATAQELRVVADWIDAVAVVSK